MEIEGILREDIYLVQDLHDKVVLGESCVNCS